MPDEWRQVPEGREELRANFMKARRRHGESDCGWNPLRVVVGQLDRGDAAQVLKTRWGTLNVEDVEEDQQVTEPGLAFDTRIVGHGPAGPTQVGAEDAVAARAAIAELWRVTATSAGEILQKQHRFALTDGGDMSSQAGRLTARWSKP